MRRITLGILLWLIAADWASAEIRFLDDRGEPVASPLEVCFQTDLRTECVTSSSGGPIEPPGQFLLLRIEGPDHGPVSLRFEDLEEGRFARVPAAVVLRQGNVILPTILLNFHLSFLGLRTQTDASGRLVIPNLAPGDYDVFLERSQIEGMIEAGSRTGYLQSVHLTPLNATELRLTVGTQPSTQPGPGV